MFRHILFISDLYNMLRSCGYPLSFIRRAMRHKIPRGHWQRENLTPEVPSEDQSRQWTTMANPSLHQRYLRDTSPTPHGCFLFTMTLKTWNRKKHLHPANHRTAPFEVLHFKKPISAIYIFVGTITAFPEVLYVVLETLETIQFNSVTRCMTK